MSYWDTSALVKLYLEEADSAVFEQHLLDTTSPIIITPSPPVISEIGLYEARATFHRKESEGALPNGGAQTLYARLAQDVTTRKVTVIDFGEALEQKYEQILSRCYKMKPFIPIRALDAIHLASALSASETEIVATDKRLRDAAGALGLSLFPT